MLSDIEIVQKNIMEPISVIAHKIGLGDEDIDYYGKYKAKIRLLKKHASQKTIMN